MLNHTARTKTSCSLMLLFRITLALLFTSAATSGAEDSARALPRVTVYPAPPGAPTTKKFVVTVDGRPLDIYNRGRGKDISFATCDIYGEVTVSVTAAFLPENAQPVLSVHPLLLGIRPEARGNRITFRVDKPRNLTILVNGDYGKNILHLFLNPPVEKPPEGSIVYGPGFHNLGYKKPIQLNSGQTLHLAGGAWVVGHVRMQGNQGVENIRITGRGVLAQDNHGGTGIWISNVKGILVEGIIVTRIARDWCALVVNCDDVTVRNYKAISSHSAATDGFNPVNSRNVTIEDSFFHTNDDCIAIKGTMGGSVLKKISVDPSKLPAVENILIRRCTFWSDFNNVICIGAETRAKHFRNIRVEDCDILTDGPYRFGAISILPIHGTKIEKVAFKNIRVERIVNRLFHFEMRENLYGGIYGEWKWPGSISNVTIRDIHVGRQANGPQSHFAGLSAEKPIRNVTFQNIRYGDILVRDAKSLGLTTNAHVTGVRFLDKDKPQEADKITPQVEYQQPDAKAGPLWLTFASGFHPEAGASDGIVLRVEAWEAGHHENPATLLNAHIKPGKNWRSHAVNLADFAGKKAVIRVTVDPGRATNYDWFQWGEPQVLRLTDEKPQIILDTDALFEQSKRGTIGWPYGHPGPLANGAEARLHAAAGDRDQWLAVGGVRKPGVFFHPAWKGAQNPVFLQWTVDLGAEAAASE
jgi:hypothetical protein